MSRPTPAYRAIDPAQLPDHLAALLSAAVPAGGVLRVALDGAPGSGVDELAAALVTPLRSRGHAAYPVAASSFWRDASLRLEYGREDVDSYPQWLDADALRREVLDPLGPGGSGDFLPSLRDPRTNRATRAAAITAGPGAIVLVHGSLLLGRELPFDRTIHLALSAPARARRGPPELAWAAPAYARYDEAVAPLRTADIAIRVDDPRHPALRR